MKPSYTFLTALAVACCANAQDINREITVDRELLPVENDARRLPLIPEVSLPEVTPVRLSVTGRAVTTAVSPSLRRLDPAVWTGPDDMPQRRGYVSLGLGAPAFDGLLSAGYRLADTEATRVAAWMQFDSNVWSRLGSWWRTYGGAVGADAVHRFGSSSLLEASASWSVDRHNMPRIGERRYWLTSNRADVSARWSSAAGSLDYTIGARYGWFGYAAPSVAMPLRDLKGVRQNRFGASADAWLPTSDCAEAGLGIDLDLLGSSASAVAMPGGDFLRAAGSTVGVLSVTPMWRLRSEAWTVAVGPRVQFTFNGGKAFHIAPVVEAAWTPSSFFAVGISAAGGEHLNTLADLSQEALRQMPWQALSMSHLPLTVGADITVGPWHGAWLRLFGGWAKANSWAMPAVPGGALAAGIRWENTDISGGHLGAEIGAKVRSWLEVSASYTAAPSDYDTAWYLSRDRARHVVDARLTVRPLSLLTVDVSWQLRAGRALYVSEAVSGPLGFTSYSRDRLNPGNVSLLTAGASYRVSQRLTVFARGENLLNRASFRLDLTPEQSARGLVGATLTF